MAIRDAANLNQLWAALLVEELLRGGVCCFCLSPGSRSTPLTVAVDRNPRARQVMHFDERGAAFHALGWAKATGRPAALVCTSGTAAANYLPAVVEAAQSCTPLIVLTADRPPELLDCGANQAIDQAGIYGKYARWTATLPCPDTAIPPGFVLTTGAQACYRTRRAPAGPVHLNCMYREPLAPTPSGEDFSDYLAPLAAWIDGSDPYTHYPQPRLDLGTGAQEALRRKIGRTERGLLVIGGLPDLATQDAAQNLAEELGWPVFADVTAGLRLTAGGPPFVAYYDQLLLSPAFREACRPTCVLHLGGPVTSKRLAEHLAQCRPEYLRVAPDPSRRDPLHHVTTHCEADVAEFCMGLAQELEGGPPDSWTAPLRAADSAVRNALDQWLAEDGSLSEIAVARIVSQQRPPGGVLFLGNSMPIRDMDRYGSPDGPPGIVVANRGASGIDGNIANAAGYANALERPVTAILGDLAALHDLNALALLRSTAAPVTLVVINNDGGGIFSFLPIAEHTDVFESCFGTPHGLGFEAAAALFGLGYARPETPDAFQEAYTAPRARSVIIEAPSDRKANLAAHQRLEKALATAVSAALP